MNKRILISLSVIGAVAAIVIGGTIAYFTDIEKSEGNTLTAGTIDISVDDQNPWIRTFSDVLKDIKPSQWRDYYYQIHNTGTNPANVWKHLKVIGTSTGIQSEPECEEEKGIWDGKKCTGMTAENNAINKMITYDLFVQTAWDQCNNGTGYSEPGPGQPNGGTGQCVAGGQPDCCNWYQTTHVHDLGKVIKKGDLIIEYTPGFRNGCTTTLTVEISADNTTWTSVYTTSTLSVDEDGISGPPEDWRVYREKLYNLTNFRYVKMTIPKCYNDYSAAYALEPIIAPEDKVKVTNVNSCWIYLGQLKPSERMFVEQSYHLESEVTNWAQGDEMKFDIELLAQQIGAPLPTPICSPNIEIPPISSTPVGQ